MSLVTRQRIIMPLRERKKSEVGEKGEKDLDLWHVQITVSEKYFKDVQFLIRKKKTVLGAQL